jgi:glycosyltransferase involved in cell wall biosynthesis
VLYVAWGFPPSRGGGVYRALATANGFAARGWDVTVLTAEREIFETYTGVDETLEAMVRPEVDVVRIPFDWPALESDVRTYSLLRVLAPVTWARLRRRRDTLSFPEPAYGPWRRRLESAAESIHARRPVDLVVATANPHVAFSAAWELYRRHAVPYVMDYRDAWLLDVFTGNRTHGPRSRAATWERRLVEHATEVWFVNAPIRAWHQTVYPEQADRMHMVANGYDEELVGGATHHERDPDAPLTFGYIGTISPKVPLDVFAEAWRAGRARSPELAAARTSIRGYLGYYSTASAALGEILSDVADAGVTYGGPVPKTDVAAVYAGFDALLLILGTGRYVTSGKVFEYLSTGLPIVSVHDPGNAATDVLRGYPLWFPARELTVEAVSDALVAAAKAAAHVDHDKRAAGKAFAEMYSREHQLFPRIDHLLHTVGAVALANADEQVAS